MRALFILGGFAATAVCVDFHRPLYPFNHFRREAALTNSSTTTTTTTTTSSSITTQLSNSTTTTNSSMPFCTGCVIEVIGVVTLTYTAPVTTYTPPVTIVVTPLIITGTDGSITTTTVPATTPANATFGFSNMTALVTDTNSLTFTWWGAPDIIMTYPTTYLGFSDFAGGLDTMTIRSQDLQPACTQSTTELDIDPTVLDIDSVEYRVKATMMLPEDLLSYVSGFADVKSIFSGVALTDCTAQPVTTTSVTGGESFLTTSSEGPELSTSTVVSFPTSYAPASHTSIQGPLMGPSNSGGVQSHGNIASGGGGVNPIGKVTASVGGGTGFGPQKPAPPSPPAQQTASEKGFGNVIASILAAGPNGPTASPPGQKPNNPANPPPQQENNPNTPNNPSKPNDENGNNPPSQTITIGGQPVVITPAPQKTPGSSQNGPGGIILPNGQTLGAGQSTTLNGVIVSVPPSGSSVVISNPNGGPASTVAINQPAGVAPPSQTVTIGGQPVVITPAPAGPSGGVILPNGQTLAPGQTTTLNGVLISVPPGGSQIVIGGTSTVAITPADNPAAPLITSPPVLTVAGLAVSPTVSGGSTWYSIAPGVTLTPGGPAVTVSGTTYSLPPGNTVLLINGQTSEISLGPASASATTTKSKTGTSSTTSSQSKAPGDYVASGVGASSTSKKSGAASGRPPLEGWVEGLLITIAGWLLF